MVDFDEKNVARELKKLSPGFLPLEIFYQVARLWVTVTIELIPLVDTNTGTKIILTQRDKNDRFWPNMWHVPGAVLLSNDSKDGFNDVIKRIYTKELSKAKFLMVPVFSHFDFRQTDRGAEVSFIHWVRVGLKNLKDYRLISFEEIENSDVIPSQIERIVRGYKDFEISNLTNRQF